LVDHPRCRHWTVYKVENNEMIVSVKEGGQLVSILCRPSLVGAASGPYTNVDGQLITGHMLSRKYRLDLTEVAIIQA